MSQHDFVLDNDNGQNFRTDLNNALLAMVSNSSGATEPTTKYAYQFWADTTTGLLKIRNAANSGWVTIMTLADAYGGLLSLTGGTMTGVLLAKNAATVATPDIAFAGDANTGVYSPGADLIALVGGGTELLRADGILGYVKMLGTKGLQLPSGTTAQRPTGVAGLARWNSDLTKVEVYNGSSWIPVGGGGGGGGIKWAEISGTAPIESEEYCDLVYLFGAGLAQELYTTIKVPQSYTPGAQIFMYVSAYSPSSSNTILLSAQATLIRTGTTAMDAVTNQRTTTNSALTNTVAKMGREFVLDLTDSSGQINGQAVAAGDMIKVRLYRGTDTDTADIRMIPGATDLKTS